MGPYTSLLCSPLPEGRITRYIRPSVRPSVCPMPTVNPKSKHILTLRRKLASWIIGRAILRSESHKSRLLGEGGEMCKLFWAQNFATKYIESRKTKTRMMPTPCCTFLPRCTNAAAKMRTFRDYWAIIFER